MRNLQKILALALALIMSFSLVVTANAAFSDEADISEAYTESVNVLSKLEVFKGYTDGTYQPQKSITRAEVAAIIYRIATGDVADEQVAIYSDWNRFTDVHAGEWWAGYINYCANAEYIKGYGNGKFGPDDDVTGYEALAMILRALGYGKMGEFVGSDWAVNTAARANSLKITKNVTSAATLGAPATRELVAELLFRSILQKTVTYNTVTGYVEDETTLGKQTLNLDEIEGIVVANEYANLNGDEVLAKDKTDLDVNGTVRSLDYSSDLKAIGESRYAYVVDSKVLALADTGKNVQTFDNTTGKAVEIDTKTKFKKVSGLEQTDDTEFYTNFGFTGIYDSDYRIEIAVSFDSKDAEDRFDKYIDGDISKIAADLTYRDADTGAYGVFSYNENTKKWSDAFEWPTNADYQADVDAAYNNADISLVAYRMVFRADDLISNDDLKVIKGIFGYADDTQMIQGIEGSVWIGTTGANIDEKEEADLSNSISYKKFKEQYINEEETQNWKESENGQWVKIVDNNNDGKAEYAFLTNFHLDKAIDTYTKSGEDYLEYYALDIVDDLDARYMNEVAEGDVVLWTDIDGQALIWKAEYAEDEAVTISLKDETVTTKGGETYGQSGIVRNETEMDDEIVDMERTINYRMYFDPYGFVRAYEPVDGTRYALITELYGGYEDNGRFVETNKLTAELMRVTDSKPVEYTITNDTNGNDFRLYFTDGSYVGDNWDNLDSRSGWTDYRREVPDTNKRINVILQPAVANLGFSTKSNDVNDIFDHATTNVVKYVISEEDGEATITTAAERNKANDGWAVNYFNLERRTIEAKQRLYRMAADTANNPDASATKNVDAVNTTEFYLVTSKGISTYVGYTNMPKIDASYITAAYAVAHLAKDGNWVADVIVIEAPSYRAASTDVSAIYDWDSKVTRETSSRTVSAVGRSIYETLNKTAKGYEQLMPDNSNWKDFDGEGFYIVGGTTVDENGLKRADYVDPIDHNFASNKIYAGVVKFVSDVRTNGGYVVVDMVGNVHGVAKNEETINIYNDRLFALNVKPEYYASSGSGKVELVEDLRVLESTSRDTRKIDVGDSIVWVENSDGDVTFSIDLSYSKSDNHTTPKWIWHDYETMIKEQKGDRAEASVTLNFVNVPAGVTPQADKTVAVNGAGSCTVVAATITSALEGVDKTSWQVGSLYVSKDTPAKNYGEVIRDSANKNISITGITGPVVVDVVLVHNSQTEDVTVTETAALGSAANVKDVIINGLKADFETNTKTYSSQPAGSIVEVTFETEGDPDDVKGIWEDENSVTRLATLLEYDEETDTATWYLKTSVVYTDGSTANTITVKSSTATYYDFKVTSSDPIGITANKVVADTALNDSSVSVKLTTTADSNTWKIKIDSIKIANGSDPATEVDLTKTTFDPATGVLTFSDATYTMTGDVTIAASLEEKTYTVNVKMMAYGTIADYDRKADGSYDIETEYNGTVEVTLTPTNSGDKLGVVNDEGKVVNTYSPATGTTVTIKDNKLTVTGVKGPVSVAVAGGVKSSNLTKAVADLNSLTIPAFVGDTAELEAYVKRTVLGALTVPGAVKSADPKTGATGADVLTNDIKDGEAHNIVYEIALTVDGEDSAKIEKTFSIKDADYAALNTAKEALTDNEEISFAGTSNSVSCGSDEVLALVTEKVEALINNDAITVIVASDSTNSNVNSGNVEGTQSNFKYDITLKIGTKEVARADLIVKLTNTTI